MEDLDRERSSLTSNENRMIIRVHQYFLNTRRNVQTYHYARRLLRSLELVRQPLREWLLNSGKNEKFSERSEQRMQGRPRKI